MKNFFALSLIFSFFAVACGVDDAEHHTLKSGSGKLVGKYKKGPTETPTSLPHHYFGHVIEGISASRGFDQAKPMVQGKKSLKTGTYRIKLKKDQMFTAGVVFEGSKISRRYELWLDGKNLMGDRIFVVNENGGSNSSFGTYRSGQSLFIQGLNPTKTPSLQIRFNGVNSKGEGRIELTLHPAID